MPELDPLFWETVGEHLPLIDTALAKGGRELQIRPLLAALEIVKLHVVEIRGPDGKRVSTEPKDLLKQPWFGGLITRVQAWYDSRYGEAFTDRSHDTVTTFALLWHTAFRVNVPVILRRMQPASAVIWLSFPETVGDKEHPLSWLAPPPVLEQLSNDERQGLERSIRERASLLRSVHRAWGGVMRKQDDSDNLLAAVWAHVKQAGERVVSVGGPDTCLASWDLQMACECALKAVALKKTERYARVHDLSRLYKAAKPFATELDLRWLDQLPNEKVMIALRYRGVPPPSLTDYSTYYTAALHIVDRALQSIVDWDFGKETIEVRQAAGLNSKRST